MKFIIQSITWVDYVKGGDITDASYFGELWI